MRIVLIGDFNLYQMLEANAKKINQLKSEFSFNVRSNFTTHIADGILDLVLDNHWSDIVQWIPSPYSDHFILCRQIWQFLRYKCKCRKVNSKHMETITKYFKEGNANINFRDMRACFEKMIKKKVWHCCSTFTRAKSLWHWWEGIEGERVVKYFSPWSFDEYSF